MTNLKLLLVVSTLLKTTGSSNGQWSIAGRSRQLRRYYSTAPKCDNPPVIPNGFYYVLNRFSSVNSQVFMSGDSLVVKCSNGYRLKGQAIVNCTSSGWTEFPKCDTCLAPSSVLSAAQCYDLSTLNRSKRCFGPPRIENGFSYVGNGQRLPEMLVGSGRQLVFNLFDYVYYECLAMHELVGESFVICLPGGRWSLLPRCRPRMVSINQYCSSPPTVSDGITYVNIPGIEKDTPFIQVNPCGALGGTFHVNEVVSYRCKRGFIAKGRRFSTCLANNTWSNPPKCLPLSGDPPSKSDKFCPTPPKPGVFDYPSLTLKRHKISLRTENCPFAAPVFRPGDVVYFKSGCQIECNGLGKWKTLIPCHNASTRISARKDSFCLDPPPFVRNSRPYTLNKFNVSVDIFGESLRSSPIFMVNEIVYYNCKPNFTLEDPILGQVKCLPGGVWSPAPYCKRILPRDRTTRPPLICKSDTLPQVPRAEPFWKIGKDLGSPRIIQEIEGFEVSTTVSYACVCGFEMSQQPATVKCLSDGTWSQPTFECLESAGKRLSCQDPPPLLSGGQLLVKMQGGEIVRITQWYYDFAWSIICDKFLDFWYECDEGYTMDGNSRLQCTEQLTWSTIPTCHAHPAYAQYRCSDPPKISDSSGYYRWLSGKLVFVPLVEPKRRRRRRLKRTLRSRVNFPVFGSTQLFELYETVSYNCRPGYTILGSSMSECQFNRTWSATPICWPTL